MRRIVTHALAAVTVVVAVSGVGTVSAAPSTREFVLRPPYARASTSGVAKADPRTGRLLARAFAGRIGLSQTPSGYEDRSSASVGVDHVLSAPARSVTYTIPVRIAGARKTGVGTGSAEAYVRAIVRHSACGDCTASASVDASAPGYPSLTVRLANRFRGPVPPGTVTVRVTLTTVASAGYVKVETPSVHLQAPCMRICGGVLLWGQIGVWVPPVREYVGTGEASMFSDASVESIHVSVKRHPTRTSP
jgi:hypothetical protein